MFLTLVGDASGGPVFVREKRASHSLMVLIPSDMEIDLRGVSPDFVDALLVPLDLAPARP